MYIIVLYTNKSACVDNIPFMAFRYSKCPSSSESYKIQKKMHELAPQVKLNHAVDARKKDDANTPTKRHKLQMR